MLKTKFQNRGNGFFWSGRYETGNRCPYCGGAVERIKEHSDKKSGLFLKKIYLCKACGVVIDRTNMVR